MRIAVLFDGAGLARLGLEEAGHECTGVELDPYKHYLSQFIGSGNCVLGDALDFDFTPFDAVWASPPCQWISSARTQGNPTSDYSANYLGWCLKTSLENPEKIFWIENVASQKTSENKWGRIWNAAQFQLPGERRQNRNRVIGGFYPMPKPLVHWKKWFPDVCPTITATEYKGCASDKRRASRHYGRKLTLEECAYHQGLDSIPREWLKPPDNFTGTPGKWKNNLYEAIGNGVPVWMAKAFGEAVYRQFPAYWMTKHFLH